MNETRKLSTLKNWEKNPWSIKDKDFERLKTQIRDLGQYKPLLITDDGIVLGGNMRLRAYKELGIDDIWVSVVDAPSEDKKLEYALSDNDRAGFYDSDLLANLIPDYPDFTWEKYAVDLREPQNLKDLIDSLTGVGEDNVPEVSNEMPKSILGTVYSLGKHRLMCGDSTNYENMKVLMGEIKSDMVFTDPPYGVNYEGKTKDKLKIENDINTNIFQEAVANISMSMKMGAAIYVCCPPGNNFKSFIEAFEDDFYQSSTIIWVKNSMVLGHGDYHYQHEPILYGWVKDSKHTFYGGRDQVTVWNIDRPSQSKEHPTMKPIALIVKAIRNSSKEEDIILDPFLGSGSTLIACEQTNRICYGMEIDPKYCDVIRKRYARFIEKEDEWEAITPQITG